MKRIFVTLAILFVTVSLCYSQAHEYKVVKTYHIASPGGWDYIAVNNGNLYVSHGTQVNILNKETGDSVGYIPNTTGVHGIAFDNEQNKGYTSNGRLNTVTVFDLKKRSVTNRWSLSPAEGPTGLAYDHTTKRLFAGCEKLLVVVNAENGSIVDKITIGEGCDGVAFDSKNQIIYTSNGEGNMSAIKEVSADKYTLLGNYPTKRGARTITIDEKTGTLYLPTAEFDPTKTNPNGRPAMVPGTFQVLVVQ